jgi:hypothetical protein
MILRSGVAKTRKDHRCHGCMNMAHAGTYVYFETYTYDGEINTIYMCDECKDYCKNHKCNDCMVMETATEGYIHECKIEKNRSI